MRVHITPSLLAILFFATTACSTLHADTIYVDSLRGDDAFDGRTADIVDDGRGPVRTIRRGVQLLVQGGTLSIANNGAPYYESIALSGEKHSGVEFAPLTIIGNGAVLNGSRAIPAAGWKLVGEKLWKLKPHRKGHYLLILDNAALLPVKLNEMKSLNDLGDREWAVSGGSIYFRTKGIEEPSDLDLRLAVRTVGISLYAVHDVVIRGLTLRHFRLDGVNANDHVVNVLLEDVKAEENGRAGVSIHGTSFLQLVKPTVRGNHEHSVLITSKAGSRITEGQVQPKPTVPAKSD